MKFYIVVVFLMPALLQAADKKSNIFSMIQERQYQGDKQLSSILSAEEKNKILESAGAYKSPLPVPINIKEALDAGALPIISKLSSEPFSTLRILPGYSYDHEQYDPVDQITYDETLKYINNADGLAKDALFYANGRLYGPLGIQPLEFLGDFDPEDQAEIMQEVQTLFLQNTNITEILPNYIARFPNLQRVVLTPSTPANIREQNSRLNPGITFEYRELSL